MLLAVSMPNFANGFIHSITMLGASESLITEWRPAFSWVELGIQTRSPALFLVGLLPWATLVGSLLYFARIRACLVRGEEPPLSIQQWFLCVGIGLITVRYGRFAWLVILPMTLALEQWPTRSIRTTGPGWGIPLLSTVLLGTFLHYQIGVVGGGFGNATSRIHSDLDTKRFPVASACFLRSQGLEGRAFPFQIGEGISCGKRTLE